MSDWCFRGKATFHGSEQEGFAVSKPLHGNRGHPGILLVIMNVKCCNLYGSDPQKLLLPWNQ